MRFANFLSGSERDRTTPLSFLRRLLPFKLRPKLVDQPRPQPNAPADVLRDPALSPIHLPVEIWEEIMKYLEKPELHTISKASVIIRNISLPFLFHTVHLYCKDRPALLDLVAAYVYKRPPCKNMTELRLDYFPFFSESEHDANFFTRINREPMCRLTTLVIYNATLGDVWIQSILSSQTLRRLHFDRCWFGELTTPFPSTNISEFALQPLYDSTELGALVRFLTPQLEVLEVYGLLPSAILVATCPRLQRYVVRVPKWTNQHLIHYLYEFLVRTTTIEHLELGFVFPSSTLPLPPPALPNLRLFDVTLSHGFPATKLLTGPRKKLRTLRIRDDLVWSHDLDYVGNFLDIPYEVSELHLAFRKHNVAELLSAQLKQGLPDIERLSLDIKANHICLIGRGDLSLCRSCTVLDPILIGASEFVNRVKAAHSIQDDDSDCPRRACLHKLKKIDVDIDVDSTGTTTPHELDEWFRSAILAKCPALEEVYLRVWKANDRGVEEDRARLGPRFWARWSMGIDESWRYKWGLYLGT